MVEFDILAALVGGFVGTVVMSLMMTMATSAGMSNMPSMPLISGSMVSGDRSTAMKAGAVMHYIVMGTVVFGLIYAALFAAFDEDAWWLGALIGLAHGAVIGLVFMPMMSAMHPRMSRRPLGVGSADGRSVATDPRGEIELAAPGVLGKNWGGMTPLGVLMGHVVYGIVLALVYGWLA